MVSCGGRACLVHDAGLTEHALGPEHPAAPRRVDLTLRLAEQLGVLDGLHRVPAPVASVEQLLTVHEPALVEAVLRMEADPGPGEEAVGLGADDTPVFAGMHTAAAHVVGATLEACRQVLEDGAVHAVNLTGGLVHATRDRASGFCVYNDVAVGIQWLLDHGARRVAYVDVGAHHADGVEQLFFQDPRVLTVSLHESGQFLFPGTGETWDVGGSDALGTAVNVPLAPGTGDAGWLRAFHAVVEPVVRAFAPDVLVTQHGCDTHADDPLAHLMLSVDGQRATALALHDLAHEVADGRWVATGGGGNAVVQVVPRAWTHLLAVVAGAPLDPATETPAAWREHVRRTLGRQAPQRLTDGRPPSYRPWEEGFDPGTWLDRTVQAVRLEVFGYHDLDPHR